MPIASAISGMEMPGRDRTSSSACLERVPLPRGRPRRPLPLPLPLPLEPPAARRDVPDPPDARPRRVVVPPLAAPVDRPPPPPSSAGGAAPQPAERGGRRLEAVKFVDEGAKLLQARVDLTLLLFQEIGHVATALYSERLTRQSRQARRRRDYL